jgi:(p)ppGpp synthase/HD superfamily hydrolase
MFDLDSEAVIFAITHHGQQKRRVNNEPYICHPIRVAVMAQQYVTFGNKVAVQHAALFHDLLEDTGCSEQELRSRWGDTVADMVIWLTNDKPDDREVKARMERERFEKAGYFAKVIKLCDIIDNAGSFGEEVGSKWCRRWVEEKKKLVQVIGSTGLVTASFRILHNEAQRAIARIDQ